MMGQMNNFNMLLQDPNLIQSLNSNISNVPNISNINNPDIINEYFYIKKLYII